MPHILNLPALLLLTAPFFTTGGLSNIGFEGVRQKDALTASIMSDDYTTYRRTRGDASRVGQRDPIVIAIQTA